MSRSPDTALSWQKPAWPHVRHLLAGQIRISVADLRNVPRYALRTSIGMALVCGLLSLWGLHGDGAMPSMSSLSGLDPYRISSGHCIVDQTDAEARWDGLSPALAILDRVNPAVAAWAREKHDNGRVVFRDESRTACDPAASLAKYDMLLGRLAVNRELFCENDGTIALTFCHEYRHSRQNLGKFCQYVLSFLFVRGGNLPIIENDAVIYEQQAHNAIFGNGRSTEKELAAWEAAQREDQDGSRGRMASTFVSVVANQTP
jgi:hypothetical protein